MHCFIKVLFSKAAKKKLANLSGVTLIIPDVGFHSQLLFGLDISTLWLETAMFPAAGENFSWSNENGLAYLELKMKKLIWGIKCWRTKFSALQGVLLTVAVLVSGKACHQQCLEPCKSCWLSIDS